jgi:hypothetical protein
VLVRLQGNLLGKNDIPRRQAAKRHETQTQLETARIVDLINVRWNYPIIDAVPFSAVATDDLEIA